MLTVKDLRQRGYKVFVTHTRMVGHHHGVYNKLPIVGITTVEIHGDGFHTGLAKCSIKDQWNRKRGTRIALGRALKKMGLKTK
jgi:hypothetical protein